MLLIKGDTPAAAKAQPVIKTSVCQCGAEIQFTTCPKRYCVKCSAKRKLESARAAMTKQRRNRGIAQVKGVVAICDKCRREFLRRSIKHRFCDECAPAATLERARENQRLKRRARNCEEIGTVKPCIQCEREFRKEKRGRQFYCEECRPKTENIDRFCLDCKKPILPTGKVGRYKVRCQVCAHELRKRKQMERYFRKDGRDYVAGSGTKVKCQGCPTQIVKTRSDHTFCDRCLQDRANECNNRTREIARRASGAPVRSGVAIKCDHCGRATVRNAANGKFCRKCKNQSKIRSIRKRLKTDHVLALNYSIAAAIRKSLNGTKAGRRWESLVGYTIDDLKPHIERQFSEGMSWDNRDAWHIDHVVPLRCFSFQDANDDGFKAAWAITNLRPLWATENLKKNGTRLHLL